jgi:type I restriction enzyme S subunit
MNTDTAWPHAKVGDLIIDMQPGFACGAHNSNGAGIPHLRPMNVSTEGRIDRSVVKFVGLEYAKRPAQRLRRGDVLFNNTNSPELVGKTAFFTDDDEPAFSNHMTRLRPDPTRVDPEFLALMLHQAWRSGWFAVHCNNHVSQASIGRGVLEALEVSLPPLDIQRSISALNARVSGSRRAAVQNLSSARLAIDRFRQSVRAAAYSGRLTEDWRDAHSEPAADIGHLTMERRAAFDRLGNRKGYTKPVPHDNQNLPEIPETWNWLSADAVSSQITDGEHIQPPYQATGFPMLSAKHVRDGFVDATGAGVIAGPAFEQARKRCAPAKGDLLVVSVGATTGRTAMVQIEEPFAIVRSVLLLKPLLQPRFLLNWLRSQWAFDWMRQASGASAQPHLYIRDLRRLPVPVPPLAEQEEIVRVVDTLLAQADSIEQRLRLVATHLDKVSNAVLGSVLGDGTNGAAATASAQG